MTGDQTPLSPLTADQRTAKTREVRIYTGIAISGFGGREEGSRGESRGVENLFFS